MMKTYFFTVKHAHWREGTTAAITAGFVIADDEAAAEKIIYEKMGENIFDLSLTEIKENETFFADYIPAAVFK